MNGPLALLVSALLCSVVLTPAVANDYGQYNFDEYETLSDRLDGCFRKFHSVSSCPYFALEILYDGKVKEDIPAAVAKCLKEDGGQTEEEAQEIYQCTVAEMAKPLEPSRVGLYAYYEADAIERRVYDCFQTLPIDSRAATCIDLTEPLITASKTKEATAAEVSKCVATYPLEASKVQEISSCLETSLGKGFEEATDLDPLYDEGQVRALDARTTRCAKKVRFTTKGDFDDPPSHCTMDCYLRLQMNGAAKNLVPGFYATCLEGQNGDGTEIFNIEETRQCLIKEMSKDV